MLQAQCVLLMCWPHSNLERGACGVPKRGSSVENLGGRGDRVSTTR